MGSCGQERFSRKIYSSLNHRPLDTHSAAWVAPKAQKSLLFCAPLSLIIRRREIFLGSGGEKSQGHNSEVLLEKEERGAMRNRMTAAAAVTAAVQGSSSQVIIGRSEPSHIVVSSFGLDGGGNRHRGGG